MSVRVCLLACARSHIFATTRWDLSYNKMLLYMPHWCKCEKFLGRFGASNLSITYSKCVCVCVSLTNTVLLAFDFDPLIERPHKHNIVRVKYGIWIYVILCVAWTWHGIISQAEMATYTMCLALHALRFFICFIFDSILMILNGVCASFQEQSKQAQHGNSQSLVKIVRISVRYLYSL